MILACALGGGCSPAAAAPDAGPSDAGVPVDAYDGTGDGAAQRSCLTPGTPGCGLVAIAGGTFTIGEPATDGGAYNASPPQPDITVDAFQIDRFEVTKARFRAFWDAGHPAPAEVLYPGPHSLTFTGVVAEPLPPSAGVAECNWVLDGRDDHPINCIDWPTAQAFCVWDGGRLPTAAEWELAARGVEDRTFPWGEDLPTDALLCGHATHGTCPVGSRTAGATPDGLYDMVGNVREWNADWYMAYTDVGCWGNVARTNPLCENDAMGGHDVVGGSWVNDLQVEWLHPASRYWGVGAYVPGEGLRCAR